VSDLVKVSDFELEQRQAKALSVSSLMPAAYQNNVANCLIAIELSRRIGASPMMVAQNLDVIGGRPSWRSTFLIATINAASEFGRLRFVVAKDADAKPYSCHAAAKDADTGEDLLGPTVTMEMARDEGWVSKAGSKWKTMPELMLCYRAAAFWARLYASHLLLGLQTTDEMEDVGRRAPRVQQTDITAVIDALPDGA
jgi:hypothetical protein